MPENVRDRDELLLNAIVTGDTSGIDPRDREETFIKAIAEKSPDSFYPFGTAYEFRVNTSTQEITRVLDGFGEELDFSKIKPRDLMGSMIVVNDAGLGYAFGCTIVTSPSDLRYYTIIAQAELATINSVAINFDTKKVSYSAVHSF